MPKARPRLARDKPRPRFTAMSAVSIWIILLVLYLIQGQFSGTAAIQLSIVAVLSVLGIASAFGLYKLKKWAMISSVIFFLIVIVAGISILLQAQLQILGIIIEDLIIFFSVMSVAFLLMNKKIFHK